MLYFLGLALVSAFGIYFFIRSLDCRAEERSKEDESLLSAYPWSKIAVMVGAGVIYCILFTVLMTNGVIGHIISLALSILALVALLSGIYVVEDEFQGNALTALSLPVITALAISVTYLFPITKIWPFVIGVILYLGIHFWNQHLTETA